MTNLDLDLDELDRLAEAATPGPWFKESVLRTFPDGIFDEKGRLLVAIECCASMSIPEATANQAFIAAANPQIIKALIARVRAAEEACVKMETALSEARDHELAFEPRLRELGATR